LFVVECPAIVGLPALPALTSCNIPDYCTGVDCCVDVNLLGKSFNAFVSLDPCNLQLRVGIENWIFNLTLVNYNWGHVEEFNLNNVVRIQ
jgi:hypothetical protein